MQNEISRVDAGESRKVPQVARWERFEVRFEGPVTRNPFTDVLLSATFTHAETGRSISTAGFYDGDGQYAIRFMPELEGMWTYATQSNRLELEGQSGSLACVPPEADVHGPVRVKDGLHFAYADGTPFFPVGTTSYGWVHQAEELTTATVESLRNGPFNKIRMCTLPHHSRFSAESIRCFPFEGEAPVDWDYDRFNPEWFRMIEQQLDALMQIGVEADLILFHPYTGPWRFKAMPHAVDLRYVRYLVARFASFRNVWWSLANEYDFIPEKPMAEWDALCRETAACDPYAHLLSIHNGTVLYAHWQPWITHACVQDGLAVALPGRAVVLRNAYHKPVIYDEFCYEGNFNVRWGDLSGEETVFRFWEAMIAGTYAGHGEVFAEKPGMPESEELVWTAIGGVLRGAAPDRIAFMRRIFEEGVTQGWEPADKWWQVDMARNGNTRFLFWFGKNTPASWEPAIPEKELDLTPSGRYRAEIIDAWNMTITPVEGVFTLAKKEKGAYWFTDVDGKKIDLPGRPLMAVRLTAEKWSLTR